MKKGTLWSPFEESYEKARGGKARGFCSSFDLFVPLYPILDFEVIFYHGPSRLPDSPEGMHAWHSREGVADGRKGGGRDTHVHKHTRDEWPMQKKKKKNK